MAHSKPISLYGFIVAVDFYIKKRVFDSTLPENSHFIVAVDFYMK